MKSNVMIRDSIHGDIEISENVAIELISTMEFRRLRRIQQFGGCMVPFPSGNHTRFSHSIGVYHIIDKIFKSESFNFISPKDKLLVKLAGLLHDIGHGPFSHSFECISKISHEEYGQKILESESTNINKILKKHKIPIDQLTSLILGKHPNMIFSQLVSSQLDADRLDYLVRDSKSAGVKYSIIDIDWIIHNMVIENKRIIYDEKAKYAIENYLVSRYHMYKQIYTHYKSGAFDAMLYSLINRMRFLYNSKKYIFHSENIFFLKYFIPIIKDEIIPIDLYCEIDDYSMHTYIKLLMKESDTILSDLASRFTNYKLFKLLPSQTHLEDMKKELLIAGYDPNYYLIKDHKRKIAYYDFEKICQNKSHEIIWIKTKEHGIKKFINLSEIIDKEKIKKPINIVNYYAIEL